jgi:hypothetical protein
LPKTSSRGSPLRHWYKASLNPPAASDDTIAEKKR